MLNFFKEHIRNKALKGQQQQGPPVFLNMKEIKSVGFAFSLTSSADFEELNQIAAFLEGAGVSWQGVAVEGKKGILKKISTASDEQMGVKGVVFVRKEQMNRVGVPEVSLLEPFLQNRFDLFISLNNTGEFTLDYIARGVKTGMLAGMKNTRYNTYPFVLEPGESEPAGFADYLKQLFHYLSIIKQSTDL